MSPTPGLLYVNSTIINPTTLTPSTFTSWYEQEHIPDILATSGIDRAYRYKSTNPDSPRPYLALYPVRDISFFTSDEFKSIPVHSEKYLPGDPSNGSKGCIFDHADFDTRYYQLVQTDQDRSSASSGINGRPKGDVAAKFVVVICSDRSPDEDGDGEDGGGSAAERAAKKEASLIRSRTYRLTSAWRNQSPRSESKGVAEPPGYCCVLEFSGRPGREVLEEREGKEEEVAQFELLRAFGEE